MKTSKFKIFDNERRNVYAFLIRLMEYEMTRNWIKVKKLNYSWVSRKRHKEKRMKSRLSEES